MRRILVALLPVFILAITCSKSEPAGPSGTPPIVSTNWILLLTAGYSKIPADTLSLITPESIECPPTGSTPIIIPVDTQTTAYKLTGDTLRLEMTSGAMQGIVAQMPGVDSATLATFTLADQIIKNPAYASMTNPIYAAFGAQGAHDSIKGSWVFGRIDLGAMRATLQILGMPSLNTMILSVDSMSAVLNGRLILDVSATQIKASVKRDYYTEEFVKGIADTSVYALKVTKVVDSLWTVSNTAGDTTVSITGLGTGDMVFTGTVSAWTPYTYRLHPVVCPNDEVPVWYLGFREAHKK